MFYFIYGLIIGAAISLGLTLTWFYLKRKEEEEKKRQFLETVYKETLEKKREMLLEAKEEIQKQKSEVEIEIREKKAEINRIEKRLLQRDEVLDRRMENIEKKERSLQDKETYIGRLEKELKESIEREKGVLFKLSSLTEEEARQLLLSKLELQLGEEMGMKIREAVKTAEDEVLRKSQVILATAIQKCALDHTADTTVTVVSLPNDDVKGRLIGREGRNIRAFETATGVDLIVDDTPEAVVISSFDPIRREAARLALERLIVDGRIHPARIEETVEKAHKEVDEKIKTEGERVVLQTGVRGIKPDLIKLLGRLHFRSSYGQNVLQHSMEVAHLASLIASELKLDPTMAKKCGLLHDIGKAVDHEEEGPHALVGARLLEKYGESPEVIHTVAAHHEDEEARSVYPVIVQAADTISAVRPGARRENVQAYIKRLESLERLADSVSGVEKAYAVQAGREIRVIVKPEKVSDNQASKIARDLAKAIEKEVSYPGQIKITVIREIRATDYAR